MKEQFLKSIKNPYCELHAIYEPDGSDFFGDCYCAAVDWFAPGITFRVYFKEEQGRILIKQVERWHFG